MSTLRLLWHDYRYFPYERMLAEREARLLYGGKPVEVICGLLIKSKSSADGSRLTYFKAIQNGASVIIPDQAKLEASANGNGSGWNPEMVPSLRRQSTRYSAHGLHEYRGKFNPQVVRALGNLFGLEPGAWVFDPFCGSGTTLLEAAHIGWNALGIDINPLGVLIADAKITAFTASPTILQRECGALARRLDTAPDGADWREHLPEPDYLESWFRVPVLRQLHVILGAIKQTQPTALQDVFRVILSDICRYVSLQDPGDLRIRRRKDAAENYPTIEMFVGALRAKVSSIIRAREQVQPKEGTTQLAVFGDARDAAAAVRVLLQSRGRKAFDAAITSPPYATAMPYLDTQRLSLALLGLVGSRELRRGEKTLIGNREIQDKERLKLEGKIRTNTARLPDDVIAFCRRLLDLANHGSHGFRRRNVPALAYKYLADMGNMFASVHSVIRHQGRYGLLVGRNSTELRGEEILIDTPQLLAAVAESRGWKVEEMLPFQTYQRFDVHQNNSIREEVLLILRQASSR
jgi:site-specific DNA-methyltransferase (cytosine-N4-specific)